MTGLGRSLSGAFFGTVAVMLLYAAVIMLAATVADEIDNGGGLRMVAERIWCGKEGCE